MASAVPKFNVNGDRYDMESFWGRLQYRVRMIDPRWLLETERTLREKQQILQRAMTGEPTGKTDEELWTMKFAVDGSVHPTTNDVINPLFRMSAFMPLNVPIVTAMTMPAVIASPAATIGVHWLNQSLNCAVNYANRSGDSQSLDSIAKAYVVAVSASLAGGLGATYALKRMGGSGPMATVVRATLPFCAVVASGCANVTIMRYGEWATDGVPIKDDDGVVRGKSKVAGWDGVTKCWAARFLWNVPPMMMPPLIAAPLAGIPFFASRMRVTEASLCLVGIGVGLPVALAYFKPDATIEASRLEPEFQNLVNSNGEPVKQFTFYKGI